MRIGELANPGLFLRLSARLTPWLWAVAAVLFAVGLPLVEARHPPSFGDEYGQPMTAIPEPVPRGRARPRLLLLVPLAFFAALTAVFFVRLEWGGDPGLVPSPLIGHPAPQFTLPPLAGVNLPGLTRADLDGRVTLVNVFASWCVPCRDEHSALVALARDPRFRIVGINYKDTADNAAKFLTDLGNPYTAIGVDSAGRAAIDWGVYGVPETFVVGPDGVIEGKVVGPLTQETIASTLMPAVEKAVHSQPAAPPP